MSHYCVHLLQSSNRQSGEPEGYSGIIQVAFGAGNQSPRKRFKDTIGAGDSFMS